MQPAANAASLAPADERSASRPATSVQSPAASPSSVPLSSNQTRNGQLSDQYAGSSDSPLYYHNQEATRNQRRQQQQQQQQYNSQQEFQAAYSTSDQQTFKLDYIQQEASYSQLNTSQRQLQHLNQKHYNSASTQINYQNQMSSHSSGHLTAFDAHSNIELQMNDDRLGYTYEDRQNLCHSDGWQSVPNSNCRLSNAGSQPVHQYQQSYELAASGDQYIQQVASYDTLQTIVGHPQMKVIHERKSLNDINNNSSSRQHQQQQQQLQLACPTFSMLTNIDDQAEHYNRPTSNNNDGNNFTPNQMGYYSNVNGACELSSALSGHSYQYNLNQAPSSLHYRNQDDLYGQQQQQQQSQAHLTDQISLINNHHSYEMSPFEVSLANNSNKFQQTNNHQPEQQQQQQQQSPSSISSSNSSSNNFTQLQGSCLQVQTSINQSHYETSFDTNMCVYKLNPLDIHSNESAVSQKTLTSSSSSSSVMTSASTAATSNGHNLTCAQSNLDLQTQFNQDKQINQEFASSQQTGVECDSYTNQVTTTTATSIGDQNLLANKTRSSRGRRGRPRKKGHRSKNKVNGKLWEFIRDLLLSDRTNPSFIRWERREDGVFKFVQSDKVAKMWGERKQNPKMTYEKLSRAMRYYYKSKVLLPVFGRRLVYKFGPNATGWLPNVHEALF